MTILEEPEADWGAGLMNVAKWIEVIYAAVY